MTVTIRAAAVTRLYDIHIDEITYNHFALSINEGSTIPRLFDNQPFFLHPPVYYYALASWRMAVWPLAHGTWHDIFDEYYTLRLLNVILAGFTVALLYALAKKATNSPYLALMAGLLFALDAFAIRQNTRSLMETITQLWLLVGLWAFLRQPTTTSKLWWTGCGLAFGLAIASKDTSAVFVGLLAFILIWQNLAPSRQALRYIGGAMAIPYAIWIGIVCVNHQWTAFISEKTSGLHRFIGLVQTTGYNSSTGPSKLQTLAQTLEHYGPAYITLGLGAVGTIVLLASPLARRRRWGAVGLAASAVLAYEFAFGTMEEQFLYYLLVPSLVIMVAAYQELAERLPVNKRSAARSAMMGLGALLVCYSSVSYVLAMTSADQSWRRAVSYITSHAPSGSTILVFGQGQFLFGGYDYRISAANSATKIRQDEVDYAIISKKLALDGYTPLGPEVLADVYAHSRVLTSFEGRDSGEFDIIQLTSPNGLTAEGSAAPRQPNQLVKLIKYLAAAATLMLAAFLLYWRLRRRRRHRSIG